MPLLQRSKWLLVIVLLASSCSSQTAPETALAPTPSVSLDPRITRFQAEIIEPLREAWLEGDLPRLEQLLDERISDYNRNRFADSVSGAGSFPITELILRVEEPPSAVDETEFANVDGEFRLRGLEEEFPISFKLTLKSPEGNRRIFDITWFVNPPWTAPGAFSSIESEHSLVVYHPGFPGREFGSEVDRIFPELPGSAESPDRFLVVVPKDVDGFRRIGGGGFAVAKVITAYSWGDGEFDVSNPYLLIHPENYADEEPSRRPAVVAHEMTHAMLAKDSAPFVPVWLNEGLAVYFSREISFELLTSESERLSEVAIDDLTRALTLGDHDFFGKQAAFEYSYSGAVVGYLVEQFGEEEILSFLRSYLDFFSRQELRDRTPIFGFGGTGASMLMRDFALDATPPLIRESFDMTTAELDTATKGWIKDNS